MPALSAASTGALKACRSVSATAIPSAPPVTALLRALTIWLTLELSEPVHWYSQPSSLHASAAPYWVGTKNEFVVTWLTNTNLYFLCDPNTLAEPPPPDALVPHALNRPPTEPEAMPVSAVRRRNARRLNPGVPPCGLSRWSRRSTASSTWSVSDMSSPPMRQLLALPGAHYRPADRDAANAEPRTRGRPRYADTRSARRSCSRIGPRGEPPSRPYTLERSWVRSRARPHAPPGARMRTHAPSRASGRRSVAGLSRSRGMSKTTAARSSSTRTPVTERHERAALRRAARRAGGLRDPPSGPHVPAAARPLPAVSHPPGRSPDRDPVSRLRDRGFRQSLPRF